MSRRLVLIVSLLAALTACWAPQADTLVAESRQLSTDDPGRTRLGEVEVLSIHELKSARQWFGGLSGLSFDGHTVTAITDMGHWVRFSMDMDSSGRPVAFGGLEVAPLGGLDGSKDDGDAEEVVATPEGWVVSFERRHRLLLFRDGLSGRPEPLAPPPGYDQQPENGGVEAATRLADGRLLLLSEEATDEAGHGLAWIGRPGAWQGLSYRRTGQFRPTSAALLPDGDVVVLERRFSLLGGVASRLVRLPAADLHPGAVLGGRELFVLEPPLLVDNYEAIAVHRRQDGRLVAYIIADDNFNPLQATLLMSVLLPD